MSWYVYIIQCSDDSYYTGITTNIERRFQQHANKEGAKYFFARRPVKVVYNEKVEDRSTASKREYHIKQLTHREKGMLATATTL